MVASTLLVVLLGAPTAQAAESVPSAPQSASAGVTVEAPKLCEEVSRQEELPARSSAGGRHGTTQSSPLKMRHGGSTPLATIDLPFDARGTGGPNCPSLGQRRQHSAVLPTMLQVFRC